MADSFDKMLEGLLFINETTPDASILLTGNQQGVARRWARYAFEAGRASARKRGKPVITDETVVSLSKPPITMESIYSPEELEAMTQYIDEGTVPDEDHPV